MNTLNELERAVYVAPTVENMRAYIDALEAELIEAQSDRDGNAEDLKIAERDLESVRYELERATDKIIEYENALGID